MSSVKELPEQTVERVRDALDKHDAAAIRKVITLIQEMSTRGLSLSVEELSEMIESEADIAKKVVSAANTAAFNPYMIPVQGVTQAIHLLGFNQISGLTLALLLFRQANELKNPEELREAAAITLVTAMLGRELSKAGKGENPDQTFVCALLRSFGNLLLAAFLLDDYRAMQELCDSMETDEAFRQVFGLTPHELGYQLLISSELPNGLLESLRDLPDGVVESIATHPPARAQLHLADFAVRLCDVVNRSSVNASGFQQEVEDLVKLRGAETGTTHRHVKLAIARVQAEWVVFAKRYQFSAEATRIGRNLRHRAEGTSPPFPASGASRSATEAERVTQPPMSGDISPIMNRLLKRVQEHFNFDDCILFSPDPSGLGSFSARAGTGSIYERIWGQVRISATQKNVFGIVLMHRRDILLQDTSDIKTRHHLPEWLHGFEPFQSLVIWIFLHKNEPAVVLLGIRRRRAILLSEADSTYMRALKGRLSQQLGLIEDREKTESVD